MMKSKLEEKVLEFAAKMLKDAESGHDFEHGLRVYRNVMRICKGYDNLDCLPVEIAAVLHDIVDVKFENNDKIYELNAFIGGLQLPDKQKDSVFYLIDNVSFSKGVEASEVGLAILQDADRLDALGAIGIARAFSYGGFRKRKFYDAKDKQTTVQHFYDKLLKLKDMMHTPEAKRLALERHNFMLEFLKRFFEEWYGKD